MGQVLELGKPADQAEDGSFVAWAGGADAERRGHARERITVPARFSAGPARSEADYPRR